MTDASAAAMSGDIGLDDGPAFTSTTIVAADSEVSNGFVKDGQKLPYVFETSSDATSTSKRPAKILPVCGVCGKHFVCVTTMKRHLVTHTGEKPFSCKVCGKQYTQKGNLRVHERTHRNDRPFECNICQQKFYRKEPMQKHQWRQHGIVPLRSQSAGPHAGAASGLGHEAAFLATASFEDFAKPTAAKTIATESKFYNSIVDKIRKSSLETMEDSSSRHVAAPRASDSLKSSEAKAPMDLSMSYQPIALPRLPLPSFAFVEQKLQEPVVALPSNAPLPLVPSDLRLLNAFPEAQSNSAEIEASRAAAPILLNLLTMRENSAASKPMKLKQMLAHAYQREVEEMGSEDSALGSSDGSDVATDGQCMTCGANVASSECSRCSVAKTAQPAPAAAKTLQCIGCCQVFPHKSALKAHQMANVNRQEERPFKCCKCGFTFRQKVHLQKHQWRIHQRKLEVGSSVAKAVETLDQSILEDAAAQGSSSSSSPDASSTSSMDGDCMPLDLSPSKSLKRESEPASSASVMPLVPMFRHSSWLSASDSDEARRVGGLPNGLAHGLTGATADTSRADLIMEQLKRISQAILGQFKSRSE